ncbi:hypothetical protein GF318_02245 [Candidatus Micrarchaeota archaeon]|nr:hypothetical protein [Candidatus Micrarchaeota archaeon]
MAEQNYPKEATKETCLALLGNVAPVTEELSDALLMPDQLLLLGQGPSFSTEAETGAGRVASHFFYGTPIPDRLPDYAVCISSRGSNIFATLVDRNRQIIVHENVSSMYAEKGSWDSFIELISQAMEGAREMRKQVGEFRFAVNREGVMSRL